MSDTLRFGLIGCGAQGGYLSEALLVGGQAELVACADRDPAAAQLAAQRHGYRQSFTDCREMLSTERIDAVVVATTHDQLQPSALAAVEAGKHVFVESPMALGAAEGRELVAAARNAGVRLMPGYGLHFMPQRIMMKELLDAGAVGDVAHVLVGQLVGPWGGWMADPVHGGGPLLRIGCHAIDQMLWVVECRPVRVFAEMHRHDERSVETDALLAVRFDGGVTAQVCASLRLGGRYGWIDVLGSAGRIRAEWEGNVLFVQSSAVKAYHNPTSIEVPGHAYLPPFGREARASLASHVYIRGWASELLEFIAAVQEDREPAVTGNHGVRVLEVIDAAFESERTALPVGLE